MSEQKENLPNQENPETPQQQNSDQEQQPEEENPENPTQEQSHDQPQKEEKEEGRKNKKTVTQEQSSDSGSKIEKKKLNERVGSDRVIRNPRNVVVEPLEPYLVRLEHDPDTQTGFFIGLIDFREWNGVYPFEIPEAMEAFINNWLQVRVPRLDFQQTVGRSWRKYTATGASIGEGLSSLSPPDRGVFLLQNRILSNYYNERADSKREFQAKYGASTSNKEVKISGSNVPRKQFKEVHKKREKVDDRNRKLKLKQKMPEYQDEEEKARENPEKRKREDLEEEKPSECEDTEEAWSEVNFDTLNGILQSLADYYFKFFRFPYDEVNDMDDFVKNWMRLDIPVKDCLVVIKRLKNNYKKKFRESVDQGLHFRNQNQQQLYNSSDVIWNSEAYMNSDDEREEEEKEKKQSGNEEVRNREEGGGNLEWERPEVRRRLDFPEPEYDPAMRPLLPFLVKSSLEQGPGFITDLMPVDNPVPLAMIFPPEPPFQDTSEEDNNQQKAGSGEEKPHDENPEDGSEAPEETKSGDEESKDTKNE